MTLEDITISINKKDNKHQKIKLLKNPGVGPCEAIKNGLKNLTQMQLLFIQQMIFLMQKF